MKRSIVFLTFIFLTSLFSDYSVFSTPVTNINAVYRYGQVFITWDNSPATYFVLYKSSTPILNGNNLSSAQNLGKVSYSSAFNTHPERPLRIDSASPPLSSTKGLFVATSTASGLYYYAVTTITGNIEDTTIILSSNSLSSPVNETVNDPRPYWQFDTLVATRIFNVYVWFATKVTSANYPKMTNVGAYPLNFAIVKQGTQSPHPVTFWMRGSLQNFFNSNVFGTGDPNEYIICIDDYTPVSYDYNQSWYYGYHENYDFFNSVPNPIPDTGIIFNYTSAMVNHTVNWTLRNLPVDTTRTYMTGWSLGGSGCIFNSLMLTSKIAAVFIYVPLINMAAVPVANLERLWGTYQTNLWTNEGMRRNERLNVNYLASINRNNSLPIIYTFTGKNDVNVGWSEKITFYDSMNVLKHGGFHFWSMGNHIQTVFSNPWQVAVLPPNISFLTRYRTNLSYPAFSNCSHNDNPGNGSPSSGDSIGTINGDLDWNDDIIDTTFKWEITLKTRTLVTIYDTLHAPDSCSADVTLRRLQKFNPSSGNTIQWTNTKNNVVMQQDSFTYNGGLITIPGVKIYKLTNKLSLINTSVGIHNISQEIPSSYYLYQNYPNPFNPSTIIKFSIPSWERYGFSRGVGLVTLKVFDILGKKVAILINEKLQPGTYEVTFDKSNLPSGIYFYRLTTNNFSATKKLILLK